MTELIIARTATPAQLEGRKFQNIRFFAGVKEGISRVYIEPGDEADEILEAYKAEKVPGQIGLPKGPVADAKPPAKPAP